MKLNELQIGKIVQLHARSYGEVVAIKREGARSKVMVRHGGGTTPYDYTPGQIPCEADEFGLSWFRAEEAKGARRRADRARVDALTLAELEEEYGHRQDSLAAAQEELEVVENRVRLMKEQIEPFRLRIQDEEFRARRAGAAR